MAYTTINKHTDYFNTKVFTGNGGTQSITGVGHQPDMVWFKNRTDNSNNHLLYDAVRGVTIRVQPSTNNAEATDSDGLTAFGSDGFSVGAKGSLNSNSSSIAAWNWKANGAGSANTSGYTNSTVSVNTTSGFSIVSYTGTGSNTTVGHGLGTTPTFIMIKNRPSSSYGWYLYHKSLGATKSLYLHSNDSVVTSSDRWNDTAPTSSVFTVGTNGGTNGSGNAMVAYCFADKTGFSKTGKYTLNNNNDNVFVYTGFKPKFLLIKNDDNVEDWYMMDTERSPFNTLSNATTDFLSPNNGDNETNASSGANNASVDLLSNGFKIRSTNTSAGELSFGTRSYVYVAIGQSLVGSNNVPCTAR